MNWLRDYLRRRALRRRPTGYTSIADLPFRIPGGRWASFADWTPERGGQWSD